MKKQTNLKLFRCFMLGILFVSLAINTIAQEFDMDVPSGWAVVPGYGTSMSGIETTTGGAGGEVVTVTTRDALASYAGGDTPRIILIKGTLTGSDVNVGSNKTIIGVGSDAKINGFYLNMNPSKNIIIRNLEIYGGTDAIAARYTEHLWIDHCWVHTCTDGLIDITKSSDRYTVSWCKFSDHHKTMLLNGGSTVTGDRGYINGTVHHNWYDGSDTRNPRCGFGKIHVYNNKYNGNGYCIGLHSDCLVMAEANYFQNTSSPIKQMYSSDPNNAEYGSCKEFNNIFDNCSGAINDDGNGFPIEDYYMYSFLLDEASSIPSKVESKAGPGAAYGTIGLMPTPGQGAIKITKNTLSWKTGTASPSSYKVYFGTTTNPPLVATTTGTSYTASLNNNTVYYWRVDQVTASGTIVGKLWTFSTGTGLVNIPVTGVSVAPTSATVGVGSTKQLTASLVPTTATNKTVNWTTSNSSVATVNSSGVVTGVAAGSAVITATTADGGFTAKSNVTVAVISVTGVTVAPTSVAVGTGRTTQLTASLVPADATNKNLTWSSSNTAVATVSASGVVSGVTEGTATITVKTQDGGYTASCNVTVSTSVLPTPLVSLGFNENSGSSVGNAGSVSATFTKTAPPAWSTNVPANGGASSVDFGTTEGDYYVESGAVINELAGMQSFTVTGWVNNLSSSVGSGGNRIVSWIKNGGNGVDIVYNADGSLKVGINQWPDKSAAASSAGKITTNASAPASNWKFFAVTYSASTGKVSFYFGDNTTTASLDKTISYNQGAVGSSIGKLAIGHFNAESSRASRTNRMFRGLIDQVEIYGEELSLQDIQAAQNAGVASTVVKAATETSMNSANASIKNINIYPNPANSVLNCEFDNEQAQTVTISLIDIAGKPVKTIQTDGINCSLDISELAGGMYIVNITGMNLNFTKSIVKK